jgi:cytochrome d ubiquinol oxidase subunit II
MRKRSPGETYRKAGMLKARRHNMMLQVLWFILWGVLWTVYFMLDGFDLGAGMLQLFYAKKDEERRLMLNAIGPVWNGNEVWLITAGGATFAAFPTTYALMFSYLYSALLIILFSLILRGVALEFRTKASGAAWQKAWSIILFIGSLVPALLFGVAFGNIFHGLPMDADGYHGTLLTLLNPYGLLTGLLFVVLFIEHGSLWLARKTNNELKKRMTNIANKNWLILTVITVLFLIFTGFDTRLYQNYYAHPLLIVVPVLAALALLMIRFFTAKGSGNGAFYLSCMTIILIMFTALIGLYPNLIPSSIGPDYSLTIFNSSSGTYTLKIMTIVAVIFVPIVIIYQSWIYRIFKSGSTIEEIMKDKDAY